MKFMYVWKVENMCDYDDFVMVMVMVSLNRKVEKEFLRINSTNFLIY